MEESYECAISDYSSRDSRYDNRIHERKIQTGSCCDDGNHCIMPYGRFNV